MRPKTTPTPIPAEAAGERRVLWVEAVEAEVEAVEVKVEMEVEVGTAAVVLDDTEAEYVAMEMSDVSDVEVTAGDFDREGEGVLARSNNGVVVVVDKLRVVGEIVEAKEEAGEDTGKAIVLVASFC